MKYKEALLYLDSLVSRGVKPGQKRVRGVLELLGRPQDVYPVVLVGVTNGKGSLSNFLSSILLSS